MATDEQTNDAWEQVRHLTLDEIVTRTKLSNASAFQLNGFTTPEKFPFTVVVALGATVSDKQAIELATEFKDKMVALARWSREARNTKVWP
jgi:hypothetical protein